VLFERAEDSGIAWIGKQTKRVPPLGPRLL